MIYHILTAACIFLFVIACTYEKRRINAEAKKVHRLLKRVSDPQFSQYLRNYVKNSTLKV